MLSELALRTSYHKGRDNIAEDFYLPCMLRAVRYDRAVAFFRSSILSIAWPALREFVRRGGRVRLLCSHVLSDDDYAALCRGYDARADEQLAAYYIEEIRLLLREDTARSPVRVFAALIAHGCIDLKIAVLPGASRPGPGVRIFHDKLGIFYDEVGHAVVFKGSMNETWAGLAADGNLESVDVAASWLGTRDATRVEEEGRYFEDLWNDRYPGLIVREFPSIARSEIERLASPDWERELCECLACPTPNGQRDFHRPLRPHQSAALAAWRANGRRGILDMATGSGKTLTGVVAIREALIRGELVVVVVPNKALLSQWHREISKSLDDLSPRLLRAGGGYSAWRRHAAHWMSASGPRLILSTIQTACSPAFLNAFAPGADDVFLLVDEVHRAGSRKHSALLDGERFGGPRLGLSATPERAGDPVGTDTLVAFFKGVLEPRYTLANAIHDGVLCRYFYYPHTVCMTEDEAAEWRTLSARLARLRAMNWRLSNQDVASTHSGSLLIRRARIAKRARAKVAKAVSVIGEYYRPGQRWLVYCDDVSQMEAVSAAVRTSGLPCVPYHSEMLGDRNETLQWLERRGGIVAAIRCLDEGVDIPSVSHALILASSRNPREFIQRRGRVLRRSDGKALAHVHDVLVLPPAGAPGTHEDSIAAGEIARALHFALDADNPASRADLERMAIDLRIDSDTVRRSGFEVDDEDDGP